MRGARNARPARLTGPGTPPRGGSGSVDAQPRCSEARDDDLPRHGCCCDGGALAPLSALLTLSPRLLLRDRTRSPPASLQAAGERSLSAVPADSAVASLSSFDSSFSAASAARFSADCDESSGIGESRSGSSFIVSSSIGDGSSASVGMGASPLETSSMWRAAAATCAVVGRLLS